MFFSKWFIEVFNTKQKDALTSARRDKEVFCIIFAAPKMKSPSAKANEEMKTLR